ncbi:MAG: carbamoyltransferase C-terminal domain-containing protein [candidate division FCPU426 bacterium]
MLACASEERFTGVKNQTGFPTKALEYFATLGMSADSIESVNLGFERLAPQVAASDSSGFRSAGLSSMLYGGYRFAQKLGTRSPAIRGLVEAAYRFYYRTAAESSAKAEAVRLAARLGVDPSRMRRREHHLAHAYAAYYGSPVNGQDALVLTLDGEGDTLCSTVWTVRSGVWKRLAQSPSSASIGLLYMWLTVLLGMKANEHEYKVMGLAAYAKSYDIQKLYKKIEHLVGFDPEQPMVWQSAFDLHCALEWMETALKRERFDVMAGAFQTLLEDRMVQWVEACVRETGLDKVCCGGGVFMNVKANMRVAAAKGVGQLFVFPSCGDDSVAVGAAYAGSLEAGITPKPIGDIYWGPEFSNAEVKAFLDNAGAASKYKVEFVEDMEEKVAELLESHQVVARLKGRMEFGARALGNRSILAHPGEPDTVRVINEQMKNRDFWMPFAGSVLEERQGDYLENPGNVFSPYMMVAFPTRERASKEIRAAIHPYDFSMRPQMVRESMNPSYHRLLKAFERRTGLGVLLNTSLNLHGLPVVLGPKEAYHAFENSGIRHLAMENYLVSKT